MKLEQTITWLKQGTFEAVVTLKDNNGNTVREFNRTYEQSASFFPCYNSLINVIRPFHDVTITVTTNHDVFRDELTRVFQSTKRMAGNLAELLKENNITLIVNAEGEEENGTDTDVQMSEMQHS